jgi:hypothetical protein
MWLGIEDPDGKGQWQDMYTKKPIDFAPWDEVLVPRDNPVKC